MLLVYVVSNYDIKKPWVLETLNAKITIINDYHQYLILLIINFSLILLIYF